MFFTIAAALKIASAATVVVLALDVLTLSRQFPFPLPQGLTQGLAQATDQPVPVPDVTTTSRAASPPLFGIVQWLAALEPQHAWILYGLVTLFCTLWLMVMVRAAQQQWLARIATYACLASIAAMGFCFGGAYLAATPSASDASRAAIACDDASVALHPIAAAPEPPSASVPQGWSHRQVWTFEGHDIGPLLLAEGAWSLADARALGSPSTALRIEGTALLTLPKHDAVRIGFDLRCAEPDAKLTIAGETASGETVAEIAIADDVAVTWCDPRCSVWWRHSSRRTETGPRLHQRWIPVRITETADRWLILGLGDPELPFLAHRVPEDYTYETSGIRRFSLSFNSPCMVDNLTVDTRATQAVNDAPIVPFFETEPLTMTPISPREDR